MTSPGLLCRLAARGQEEVLQTVFLLLEPGDLKACRCLSSGWNSFILERLWGSRGGRRRLESRARQRWRSSKATLMELGRAHSQVGRDWGVLVQQKTRKFPIVTLKLPILDSEQCVMETSD